MALRHRVRRQTATAATETTPPLVAQEGEEEVITLDRDIVILDTETLGLDSRAPIWEFAATRLRQGREPIMDRYFQILHNESDWAETLPERFAADYRNRYDQEGALPPETAVKLVHEITEGAVVAGSNPSFDMERLGLLLRDYGIEPAWHYHPLDIPSMALGWAASIDLDANLTWKSDALSALTGIKADSYPRHTAWGDVEWCLAQWRVMTSDEATL